MEFCSCHPWLSPSPSWVTGRLLRRWGRRLITQRPWTKSSRPTRAWRSCRGPPGPGFPLSSQSSKFSGYQSLVKIRGVTQRYRILVVGNLDWRKHLSDPSQNMMEVFVPLSGAHTLCYRVDTSLSEMTSKEFHSYGQQFRATPPHPHPQTHTALCSDFWDASVSKPQ